MTNETKHTPTPWHTDGTFFYEGELTVAMLVNSAFIKKDQRDRAAHIVKCVNMHDELVGTIKVAREEYISGFRFHEIPHETPYDETLKKAGAL